jgi:hypothetical protein
VPLNSVQLYVKGLLDGITIPGPGTESSSILQAYVTPPVLEDLDGPRSYIWGGRQRVRRQTMPRTQPNNVVTAGFKQFDYTLDIYLSYLTNPNDALVDQEFPILVDTVLSTLWNTTMPVFIDSTGNVVSTGGTGISQILSIGEEWDLEYPPEKTPATLRMLYYTCRIAMYIQEAVWG